VTDWWRTAVVYQIYPRSFADGNGDGIGDFEGATSRLKYLHGLGVDAVWLSPFYLSPQRDGGYDVADYREVDPVFGTVADAEAFIHRAHELGIRVVIDVVPNHTSSEHRFFQEALVSEPGSPAWARYHCVEGGGAGGVEPPNGWQSIFGGSAWSPITAPDGAPSGWWYLHLFDSSQPDVNWSHPDVVEEFDATLRFWFDRGVDGVRIDVAHGLVKAAGYPEVHPPEGGGAPVTWATPYFDQPEVHGIYRRWRHIADSYDPPRIFVAEAWLDSPEKRARYLREGELHTAFNFDLTIAEWDPAQWRASIDASLAADALVGAPTTWVTENHDVRRAPTRYGSRVLHRELPDPEDVARGRARSLAATMAILALPGTAYLYNGQELGLEEVIDLPDALRQDPQFARTAGAWLGRDGCRVPLPWRRAGSSLGFGPDGGAPPWLPQPASWSDLSVEAQDGLDVSFLERVRAALSARRSNASLLHGGFEWADDITGDGVLAFRRHLNGAPALLCAVNMGSAPVSLPTGGVLCASVVLREVGVLPPDSAVWLIEV
jgi:alpha-glucosidase